MLKGNAPVFFLILSFLGVAGAVTFNFATAPIGGCTSMFASCLNQRKVAMQGEACGLGLVETTDISVGSKLEMPARSVRILVSAKVFAWQPSRNRAVLPSILVRTRYRCMAALRSSTTGRSGQSAGIERKMNCQGGTRGLGLIRFVTYWRIRAVLC
jgi:hypothetical protein